MMQLKKRFVVCVSVGCLSIVMGPPALASGHAGRISSDAAAAEAIGERVPGTFDPVAHGRQLQALHHRLVAEQAATALSRPLVVHVDAAEIAEIGRQSSEDRKLRVGLTRPVMARVDLAGSQPPAPGIEIPVALGAIRSTADGEMVWTGAIDAPGATALRVHVNELWLRPGVELYVYGTRGDAFGPYTGQGPSGTGEFWTHTVAGERVMLQLRGTGPAAEEALRAAYLELDAVGFLGDRFLPWSPPEGGLEAGEAAGFCSFNAPCVTNAECVNEAAVTGARDATAQILFRSGPWWYICSGGLIADTDPSTQIPYFLTANHCISKGSEANSMEAYFHFSVPCGSGCTDVGSPQTSGATIVATSRTSDYTLLRLNSGPPAGTALLGWTASPVATSAVELHRISHPGGAPQAYSKHQVDASSWTCNSWPRGAWIYSRDLIGATEGGSSGSPVVNAAGQVVGQLSGGCGYNLGDECDAVNNRTVDGAFANYFSNVAQWLDSGPGGCTDLDGDGSCVPDDCNDGDPSSYPGAPELCTDLVDNDCDGTVNEGCDECTLGLPGDPCTAPDQCCSGKCKGRAGAQSCR